MLRKNVFFVGRRSLGKKTQLAPHPPELCARALGEPSNFFFNVRFLSFVLQMKYSPSHDDHPKEENRHRGCYSSRARSPSPPRPRPPPPIPPRPGVRPGKPTGTSANESVGNLAALPADKPRGKPAVISASGPAMGRSAAASKAPPKAQSEKEGFATSAATTETLSGRSPPPQPLKAIPFRRRPGTNRRSSQGSYGARPPREALAAVAAMTRAATSQDASSNEDGLGGSVERRGSGIRHGSFLSTSAVSGQKGRVGKSAVGSKGCVRVTVTTSMRYKVRRGRERGWGCGCKLLSIRPSFDKYFFVNGNGVCCESLENDLGHGYSAKSALMKACYCCFWLMRIGWGPPLARRET